MATGPKAREKALPFVQLDYLYTPSNDVAADARYFTEVLGGRLRPIFIYRVDDLDGAMRDLKKRGWKKAQTLEIPMGPCCSFTTPSGHRLAIYELTRPDVARHFDGRHDF